MLVLAEVVGAVVGRLRAGGEDRGRQERGGNDGGARQCGKAESVRHVATFSKASECAWPRRYLRRAPRIIASAVKTSFTGRWQSDKGRCRAAGRVVASRRSCRTPAPNGRALARPWRVRRWARPRICQSRHAGNQARGLARRCPG